MCASHWLGIFFVKNGLAFEVKLFNLCYIDICKTPFSFRYSFIQKAKMTLIVHVSHVFPFGALCSQSNIYIVILNMFPFLPPPTNIHLFIPSANKHRLSNHYIPATVIWPWNTFSRKQTKSILYWSLHSHRGNRKWVINKEII